jgi:hypothetical protein
MQFCKTEAVPVKLHDFFQFICLTYDPQFGCTWHRYLIMVPRISFILALTSAILSMGLGDQFTVTFDFAERFDIASKSEHDCLL